MMEFKGTQGNWTFSGQSGVPGHCYVAQVWDAEGSSLAQVEPTDDPMIATANARLIAAAPELLAALKSLSDMYVHCFDTTDGGGYMSPKSVERFEAEHKKAVDAIAKALGESS